MDASNQDFEVDTSSNPFEYPKWQKYAKQNETISNGEEGRKRTHQSQRREQGWSGTYLGRIRQRRRGISRH